MPLAAVYSRTRQSLAHLGRVLWFGCAGLCLTSAHARALTQDEQVLFVPSTARVLADGRIEAHLEAWVYELEERPGLSALLARHLDLDLASLADVDAARFYARTQLFRVDSESFKALRIRADALCGEALCAPHRLPRTDLGGRSRARLILDRPVITKERRWLRFSLLMPEHDRRRIKARALLVPALGVSVISDIDDTIKVSQVRDRRALLLNTFAHEFVAAPGMAARYQQLAKEPGTRFHYVSSSPVQLYPPIAQFLRHSGFPSGSVHLRESTSILNLWASHAVSKAHKLNVIGDLLADFPQRRFVLIGDSGEADPEIYGAIARAHRAQIEGIRIRDVSGDAADSARYRSAFADLPETLWQILPSDGS